MGPVITYVFIKRRQREAGIEKGPQKLEAETRVMHFELGDRGRGHEPKNTGASNSWKRPGNGVSRRNQPC